MAERHANRQSLGGATLRGVSSDRSGAGPRLHEEWKRHRGVELSNAHRFRWFKEPTYVSPASWSRSWSPQWWGARKRWQSAVSKGLSNGTDVVSIAAPPRSPSEIDRNQVHMFATHHGTNREDELFPNTTFFFFRKCY